MIPIYKLERLPAGQRRRKLALLLAGVERVLGSARVPDLEAGMCSAAAESSFDGEYLCGLARLALDDPKMDTASRCEISRLLKEIARDAGFGTCGPDVLLRLCNRTRHAILAATGCFPAEWDLIVPGSVAAGGTDGVAPSRGLFPQEGKPLRPFFPGVAVYAEDIRSPFNLGSIFRTAEAFGAERLIISPLCVPPSHPRALRSAMGCVDYLPWERKALAELPGDVPVFALETGGIPIEDFDFPERGIVILGSEELGISPEGLSRATFGRVSIPMKGIKASINVGVAFGILMQAWTAYLRCSASNPD